MIRCDVQKNRHIAIEAQRQVDLVARQLQHIDPAFRQRVLLHDRDADIAAHQCGNPGGLQDVVDQRRGGALAVGSRDANHLVRWQVRACLREQFDIADYRHAEFRRVASNRMGVERYAGRHHNAVETRQVQIERVGQLRPTFQPGARDILPVPRSHFRPARQQCLSRSQARTGETEDGIAFAGKGGRSDHRTFSVARPASASTMEIIQKRITTVDSAQPFCSK